MKQIIIKRLHLINFKGVADLTIDFDARTTDIAGRNGSGKTTVFDAFTWLLFGKDSQFNTEFDLKTLDTNGKIIYQLPHEVSGIISVDGRDITLRRRLVEKWPKRNGEPTFEGNKIERFVDDVPCKESEFNAKIAEICDEDTFKKITSPTFFVSQKEPKQKADLMRMAGEISDADIAAGNPDFEMLLGLLGETKTIDELAREIKVKKSNVKGEIADLPGRIDELKRGIASRDDDFAGIEAEIARITPERDNIDAQLTDIDTAAKQAADSRYQIATQIANRKIALQRRRDEITETALAEYRANVRRNEQLDAEIESMKRQRDQYNRVINADRAALNDLNDRRGRMLAEYKRLTERRNAIAAETLTFNDADFVCPTCHRSFDLADIETKQTEMTERFNADRAERLAAIAADIDANIAVGQRVKKEILDTTANIAATEQKLIELLSAIETKQTEHDNTPILAAPDVEPIIAADANIIRINADIAELTEQQNAPMPDVTSNRDEFKRQRAELNARIDELKSRLAVRAIIAEDTKRIAERESQYRTLCDELTELEHIEFAIAEFSKAKSEAIDARINGLFDIVRFRWVKYQINGDEKETCEATINGVPYKSLNTAGRITAGLDIINTICRFEGITAPVFIDNRESLNTIPEMQSQIVNLIVSTDDRITVKSNNSLTA
ncbi:MAG: AAA family ATPase [Roseburia sp.]|nr:AAA family ATPase [Roseburia sp.]